MKKADYELVDFCSIQMDNGHFKRGASLACSHCSKKEETIINTVKGPVESEVEERIIIHKFKKLGWVIGKTKSQHLCGTCFLSKKEIIIMKDDKSTVIPMQSTTALQSTLTSKTAPRAMTRDERYLITMKINEHWLGEQVGYEMGWSDERIATDLGTPRAFVSTVRDETFGPDINEKDSKVINEAQGLLNEIREFSKITQPIVQRLTDLAGRVKSVEEQLSAIGINRLKSPR
jgi:hypothetical protein